MAGSRLRRQRGLPGFTILSCDNMPANGVVTRQVMMTLASLQDADLAAWVERR
jgi:fructuronate reductase